MSAPDADAIASPIDPRAEVGGERKSGADPQRARGHQAPESSLAHAEALRLVERQLTVWRQSGDTDSDESQSSWPVPEAAIEKTAGDVPDDVRLVDGCGRLASSTACGSRNRRSGASRSLSARTAPSSAAARTRGPPAADLSVQPLAIRRGPAQTCPRPTRRPAPARGRDRDGRCPARQVSEQRAERAGQERPQLPVSGECGQRTVVSTPAARSLSSARGPTPGRRRTASGARNRASVPGGTTVIPPGLRRSEAILHTTFEVATPSEHVRLVRPRTAVWIAEAIARARVKSDATLAEVEVPLVQAGPLNASGRSRRSCPRRRGSTGGRAHAAGAGTRRSGSAAAPRPRSSRSGSRTSGAA